MPFFTRPKFQDRQIVQNSGSTITLSGETNINQTGYFRINKGAFPGLVATSLDNNGTVVWGPVSGLSWSISGCTSPFYVNNIVACPNSGNTIQVDAGNLALNSELRFLISLSAGTNANDVLVIDSNGFVKTLPYVPSFTGSTSGNCLSDLCIDGVLSTVEDILVKWVRVGTGKGDYLTNTVVGKDTLTNNTTGTNNTGFGSEVLSANTVGYSNTGVGTYALRDNTTGSLNTAVGDGTLTKNINGVINTAIGPYSLYSNISGYDNIAVGGINTLYSNISGYDNIAIGSNSLYNNIDGISNVAIGINSLEDNTNGYYNIAIGIGALNKNTSGYSNVAIGLNSLFNNTDGYENTAIGINALGNSVFSFQNTAVGAGALTSNISGLRNVSVGYYTLFNNITGSQNCAIGNESLYQATGDGNTSLGYYSGFNNDTGNYNTFLGYNANCLSTGLVNATAIGYNSKADQNNSMVLGDGTINVGIGTSTPSSTLHLVGLSGFTQLRLETPYTPTGTTDVNGSVGDIAWDDTSIYIKTSVGWKRTGLSTF